MPYRMIFLLPSNNIRLGDNIIYTNYILDRAKASVSNYFLKFLKKSHAKLFSLYMAAKNEWSN